MKDMERQKFENDFKDAFEQAGITPSDNLWTGIELDLEKAESKKMRRTLLVYKLMAAASITFAMFVAGAYYYAGFTNSNRDLAGNTLANNNRYTESPKAVTSATPTQESGNSVVSTSPDKALPGNDESHEDINSTTTEIGDETNTNNANRNVEIENAKDVATPTLAANNSDRAKTIRDKNSNAINGNKKNENGNEEERIVTSTLAVNNSDRANAIENKNSKNKNKKVENVNVEESIVTSTLAANTSDKNNTSTNKENANSENRNIENANGEHIATSTLAVNTSDRDNSGNKENYSTRSSEKLVKNETGIAIADANKVSNSNDVNAVLNKENNKKDELAELSLNDKKLPPIVKVKKVELDFPSTPKPDPFAVMMAKLELREKELMEEGEPKKKEKKKTNRSEKLWTSVGFAAGSFNSSSHTSSNGSAVTSAQSLMSNGFNSATSSRVASNESSASGASYSMGLNLGTKITNRWIMQGGVNYLMQNSSYQTNFVVTPSDLSSFRAASIAEFKTANSGASSDKVVSTAMYNVNNNSQFVSIPVQAGYLAVNRKVGFQINAGVSTDLFLKNIKDPQGVDIETTTQGRGSDSPYRPLNFSGLFGTELSYKLGQHYRLAINPGLRYPFNSIYKSGVGVTSNPLTMDIGMRFRYIFR
ncbi:MAG TPA: outer membrane beta-barrel protein [Cyclobacteriaceae bacterium]|jgi:hypothetical protein|nr:outer membrane beta-barrel protein [Cyclobacteriaceae bacterium]